MPGTANSANRRLKLLLMISALSLGAMLASGWIIWSARVPASGPALSAASPITVLPEPKALAEFILRDDADRVFDLDSLRGRWSFVFFGYTSCPDVCPTTLAMLAGARRSMIEVGLDPEQVQFVFVSVDPQRDSAEVIDRYTNFFDPQIRGTSGSVAQLTNLTRQLGVAYKIEYQEGVEDYPVYHSSAVFLIDPQARLRGIASPPFEPKAIARRFAEIREGASPATG